MLLKCSNIFRFQNSLLFQLVTSSVWLLTEDSL